MKKRAAKVRRRREKQKVRKPLTEEEAAQKVQGLFRTRAARRRLRLLARSVYEQVFDEASGAYFFHNVHTGDVSWEAPKLLGGEPFDEITDKFASPHDAVMAYRSLAKDWQEVPDESSSTPVSYFVNAATNESTWERPAILERLANALELRDEMLGPDWREVQDPDDGTYFFHNTKTDETQWEPPNVDFRKTPEEKKREALEEKKRQARLSKLQKKFSQANLNIGDNNDDDNDEAAENKSAASSSPKSDSDASSGPPEALMVDGDGEVASDQASFTSSDSESIYISSDEEEAAEYSKRKRRKRERQRMHHLQVLAELAGASERERGEFEAKVRLKRFRKNKQTNLLNLSHLEISDIPEEIFSNKRLSKRLKRLVLSGNRLEKLNPAIKTMQENLAELALDANELVRIPVQTWYLTSLDTLDLRYNRLREISREKGNMTVLREMNIWEIGIETMQALRVLRLDSNLFDELPDEIGTLKSLEVLTLRANRLLGVTVKNFEHLGKLRHLDLAQNQLTSLPDRFFANCPNLCVLDMSNNSLEYLPSDIVKLSSLRVLRCAQNNLVQLPEGLGRLAELENLDVSENELEALPAEWATPKLRTVNCAKNRLKSLPPTLFKPGALRHLYVRSNRIRPRLPATLSALESLHVLDAGKNELESIEALPPNLRICLLDGNKIRTLSANLLLPESACLVRFDVSDNAIRTVSPPNNNLVSESSMLRQVDFAGNELASVPGELFASLKLRRLCLARNQLGSLPEELAHSSDTLEHLDLERNRLRELPAFLAELPALRFISLNHNLLTARPDMLAANPRLLNWHANFNPIQKIYDPDAERRALLNQAALLQSEGEPRRALEILNQVMDDGIEQSSPLFLEVAQKRAMTQISLEHYAEAESDLSQSILQLDQPGAALLYYRGLARFKGLNDIKGALQDLNRSLELRPAYAPAQRVRAFCLLQMGHYRAALDNASAALDFDMYDTEAWLAKSMAQEKLLNLEDALASYQETVSQIMTQGRRDDDDDEKAVIARISPWSALGQAQYRWGLVLRDLERVGEAVVKFQDAADVLFVQYEKAQDRSLRKRNLGNWLHMSLMSRASTFQTMNRTKKARAAYEDALHFASQLEQDRSD